MTGWASFLRTKRDNDDLLAPSVLMRALGLRLLIDTNKEGQSLGPGLLWSCVDKAGYEASENAHCTNETSLH